MMKNKISKENEKKFVEKTIKPIYSNKNDDNERKLSLKDIKIEDINNINYPGQVPIKFEDNNQFDPCTLNPDILGNKLIPIYYDYYYHPITANFQNLQNNFNKEIANNGINNMTNLMNINNLYNPYFNPNLIYNTQQIPGLIQHPILMENLMQNQIPQPEMNFIPFNPQFAPFGQTKVPIRTLNDDEIIYVNYRQHFRILHRREKRKKLNQIYKNLDGSSGKPRYLHESRHRHAMNRVRNKGGRFVSKNEIEKNSSSDDDKSDCDKKDKLRKNNSNSSSPQFKKNRSLSKFYEIKEETFPDEKHN